MNNSLFFDTAGIQEFEIELNKKFPTHFRYDDIKKYRTIFIVKRDFLGFFSPNLPKRYEL